MTLAENVDLPAVIGVCIPIVAILVGLASILVTNWRKAKQTECRAVLTQTMVEKGFSASEIERVLLANDLDREQDGSRNRPRNS